MPVAFAQSGFPNKPIKILVGYPAGGPVDVLARIYGMRLSKSIDQPVIVENKPGASGSMAADQMVKSPGDGYTLLLAPVTIAIISSLVPEEIETRGGVPDGVVFFSKPVNYDELRGYVRACCAQNARHRHA